MADAHVHSQERLRGHDVPLRLRTPRPRHTAAVDRQPEGAAVPAHLRSPPADDHRRPPAEGWRRGGGPGDLAPSPLLDPEDLPQAPGHPPLGHEVHRLKGLPRMPHPHDALGLPLPVQRRTRRPAEAHPGGPDVLRSHSGHHLCDRPDLLSSATGARHGGLLLRGAHGCGQLPPARDRQGLLDGCHCQPPVVLGPQAHRVRRAAGGHRRHAQEEPAHQADVRRAQDADPLHRGSAQEEGAQCWEGCYSLRRSRLAHIRARRHPGALADRVRDRHAADHRLHRPVRAQRVLLPEVGRRQHAGQRGAAHGGVLPDGERLDAGHRQLGCPASARAARRRGEETLGAERGPGVARLPVGVCGEEGPVQIR
mmetsp:Transcript_59992/g.178571  ORF Transcript_59992/g.178571 Transcript_59992/m.178571 type:complete len:366 (-) Transcript_59992:547-1644(-)